MRSLAKLVFTESDATPPAFQLLLKDAGSLSNEVAALDSVLFLRDPFPVVNMANLLNTNWDDFLFRSFLDYLMAWLKDLAQFD